MSESDEKLIDAMIPPPQPNIRPMMTDEAISRLIISLYSELKAKDRRIRALQEAYEQLMENRDQWFERAEYSENQQGVLQERINKLETLVDRKVSGQVKHEG